MLHDNIGNIENYKHDTKLYAALVALKQFVCGESYDENSIALFRKIEDSTKLQAEAELENHHKYIDIHYVIEGVEKIVVSSRKDLERITEFSEENDCELFAIPDDAKCVELQAGDFLVVYPGESHAPMIAANGEIATVRKVVVKYQ